MKKVFTILALCTLLFSSCKHKVTSYSISIDKESIDLLIGETAMLHVNIDPANADCGNPVWESNSHSVATVENGLVTALGEGQAIIRVYTDNFHSASCTVNVVDPVVPLQGFYIDPTSVEVEVDKSLTLNVVYTPDNTTEKNLIWEVDPSYIADVVDGVVTGRKEGKAVVTAYNSTRTISSKCTVKVIPPQIPATGISLNTYTLELLVGQSTKIEAILEPSNSTDQVSWSSDDENVVSVNNGYVRAVGIGEAYVRASAGGFEDKCMVKVVELEVVYTENFQSESNLSEWVFLDNDGDGYGWDRYDNNDPGTRSMPTEQDAYSIASASYDFVNEVALFPDNWAITPKITFSPKKNHFSFGVGSWNRAVTGEKFSIYISTDRNNWEWLFDGTTKFGGMQSYSSIIRPLESNEERIILELPESYKGKDGYIAIRHHDCSGLTYMFVDYVMVSVQSPF